MEFKVALSHDFAYSRIAAKFGGGEQYLFRG